MPPKKTQAKAMDGESVVFTGFRSEELDEAIKAAGGVARIKPSKKTTVVVIPKADYSSTAVEFAKENKIKVMTLDKFCAKYGFSVPELKKKGKKSDPKKAEPKPKQKTTKAAKKPTKLDPSIFDNDDDSDSDEEVPKAKAKKKSPAKKPVVDDDSDSDEEVPKVKAKTKKKSPVKIPVVDDDSDSDEEVSKPKAKTKAKKKSPAKKTKPIPIHKVFDESDDDNDDDDDVDSERGADDFRPRSDDTWKTRFSGLDELPMDESADNIKSLKYNGISLVQIRSQLKVIAKKILEDKRNGYKVFDMAPFYLGYLPAEDNFVVAAKVRNQERTESVDFVAINMKCKKVGSKTGEKASYTFVSADVIAEEMFKSTQVNVTQELDDYYGDVAHLVVNTKYPFEFHDVDKRGRLVTRD